MGDVILILSGDFVAGEISGMKVGQWGWVGIAAFMLLLIVKVFLN